MVKIKRIQRRRIEKKTLKVTLKKKETPHVILIQLSTLCQTDILKQDYRSHSRTDM